MNGTCARCSTEFGTLDVGPLCVPCMYRPDRLLRRSHLGALMILTLGWLNGQRQGAR